MPDVFQLPRFYPIVDTDFLTQQDSCPVKVSELLLEAGVRIIQYRHKQPWTEQRFEEAKKIAGIAKEAGALFVLNDRVDYARLLETAVHVGQDDLPPLASRKVLVHGVIGLSTHNRVQLQRGDGEPVQYLALGPIFSTRSKSHPDPVVGLDGLRKLRPLTRKPVVAIGGITLANAQQVLEAGADSIATVAGVLHTDLKEVKARASEWLKLAS